MKRDEKGGVVLRTFNVVIMAGGSGTRFWPLSREVLPKQFISFIDNETLLQRTYRLYRRWLQTEQVHVITTKNYRNLVKEQLPELSLEQLIVEPASRDTAACIALTAISFLNKGSDEVLIFAPSDHYISNENALRQSLEQAVEAVREAPLSVITIGIVPTRAETGYGYIRTDESPARNGLYRAQSFVEKPDKAKAEALIQEHHVFWNSGILVWKPSAIRHYMLRLQPELWKCISEKDDNWESHYEGLPRISIDYAILEKVDSIYTVPYDFFWDDVGVWTALERFHRADQNGNIVLGCSKDEVYSMESERNIIYAEQGKVAVLGASDLIIVSTSNGLLICNKSCEQKIKSVISSRNYGEGKRL